MMRRLLWVFAVLGVCQITLAADLDAGQEAYRRGDFPAAMAQFEHDARAGDALAQYFLGAMYYEGHAVSQDHLQALNWFRRAANQGNALAQYKLASMYFWGQAVAPDMVQSRFWMMLAARQGDPHAFKGMRMLSRKMTEAEMLEASNRVAAWQPTPETVRQP